MSTTPKRSYRSQRRRENAAETRRRILASARKLFIGSGYGATTIDAIARLSGVAAQTVYAGFGSKRGVLFALLDEIVVDADMAGLEKAIKAAAGDAPRQLRERIAFNVRLFDGAIDLVTIVRTISGVEADSRAMWEEGEARRYRTQREMVEEWARTGSLAPGLTVEQATDRLWALTGPDVYRLFVVERGWRSEDFRGWLVDTLEPQLLT